MSHPPTPHHGFATALDDGPSIGHAGKQPDEQNDDSVKKKMSSW
jgi:hypothetical protein